MATLPNPHTWTAGDDATSTRMQTLTYALDFLLSPPRCRAYQSVAQTLTTAVQTAITFTSEDVDTDGIHSTSTDTSRMTIVTAGRYRVVGSVAFVSNSTGYRQLILTRNGSAIAVSRAAAVNGTTHVMQITDEILCTAGQYLEVFALQNSGGNLDTVTGSSNTFLHVVWVSES